MGAILDGGPCTVGIESTIVDLSRGAARLLRPGGVTWEQVRQALAGDYGPAAAPGAVPRAPGMLPQHYAPRAALRLFEAAELPDGMAELQRRTPPLLSVALLAPAALLEAVELPFGVLPLSLGATLEDQARRLYAALREADEVAVEIWAVLPPPGGLGSALRDRLWRAAGLGALPDTP
jgi:L-threonylcarbamoyladenylate synthase